MEESLIGERANLKEKNLIVKKIKRIVKEDTFEGLFMKRIVYPGFYTLENEKRFEELFKLKEKEIKIKNKEF